MNAPLRLLGLVLLAAATARAQSGTPTIVATPAAGYTKLTARAASDSLVAIPLVQRSALVSQVSAVTSNSVTLAAFGIADGAYAPGPGGAYYLQFISGNLAGLCYEITGSLGDVVTLDTRGDNLANHPLGQVALGATADLVRIRPFWTIGSVFGTDPAQLLLGPIAGFNGTSYAGGDAILFPDTTSAGSPKPPANSVSFVTGSGWRSSGAPTVDASTAELWPGLPFTLRRAASAPSVVTVVGSVSADPLTTSFPSITASTDFAVALGYPAPLSLAASGLYGATKTILTPSADALHQGDQVLVFPASRQGFSPPPDSRFYVAGGHWFETSAASDAYALLPGVGYLVRLSGAHPASYWVQSPPRP